MRRFRAQQLFVSFVISGLLLPACSGKLASDPREADARLTEIEQRLASGGDNTELCFEYIGVCEQGLGLCLEGNNAETYQTFCSGLQERCRTTVEEYCRAPQADAGPVTQPLRDAGIPPADAGSVPPPDAGPATGPVISSVSAVDITQTTANISWRLSEFGTGQVEYGATTSYGQTSVKETSFRYSAHLQALSHLTAGTLYHYRVRSSNPSGIESVSGDFTFTTAATTTAPLPAGGAHAPPPTSPLVVSVRETGARCDGATDDTAAIQRAVDRVGGTGGTVLVPAGTCMVNAVGNQGAAGNARYGILLKSNMTFKLESGAVLKAKPNNAWSYNVVFAVNVSNVNIVGGTVEGERHEHLTLGDDAATAIGQPGCNGYSDCLGQWGHCVSLLQSSNIFVDSVQARECWGDGFTVSGSGSGGSDITFSNVLADDNRRQGLSIIAGRRILVQNSIFRNTHGHGPAAGIDVEPNATMSADTVTIRDSQFLDNHGSSIVLAAWAGDVSNVTVERTMAMRNGWGIGLHSARDGVSAAVTKSTIKNNTVVIVMRTDRAGLDLANPGTAGNTLTNNLICSPLPFAARNAGVNTVANNSYNPPECEALKR